MYDVVTAPAVVLTGVGVNLGGRPVLHDIDLRVDVGEVVAVLGANGSGKSTMIRAMLGLTSVTTGQVELFGQPLSSFAGWSRIGYVPQRVTAASGVPATVREVVSSGRLSRMRRFARQSAADRAAIDAALDTVGLSDRARDSVQTLSGGQQQRVLIARALACSPDLLVLDEPTSGVDADSQQALAEAFARLVADRVTVVLVAHEIGPMLPLLRRAVVMKSGRVLHDGPPPDADHLHEHDPDHAHPAHDRPTSSLWGGR